MGWSYLHSFCGGREGEAHVHSLSAACNVPPCGGREYREARQLLPWPSPRGMELVREFYLDASVLSDQHLLFSLKILHVSVKYVTGLSPTTKVTSFLKQSPNVCSAGWMPKTRQQKPHHYQEGKTHCHRRAVWAQMTDGHRAC